MRMAAQRMIVTILYLLLVTGCAQLQGVFKSTPSPPAPARPTRQESLPASVRPTRQEPPTPRLSPQVSSDREMQLTEEVNTLMRGVERTLLSIDRLKLTADQWETHQTISSFLTQAREALTTKDFQQAINLAQKAHVLSDELSKVAR